MPHRSRRTLPVRAIIPALLLGLTLTACGGTGTAKDDARPTKDGSAAATEDAPPPPEPRLGMPKVGQCSRMTYPQSTSPVSVAAPVPCRGPHNAVVAYAGLVSGALTAQTPVERRRQVATKVCEPAFRRVVGGTPADRATTLLTWVFFTPSAEQLERGARWVRCDVLARSGRELVPLPRALPVLRQGIPDALRVCQDRRGRDVSCARPHQFRVQAVFVSPGNTYPGPAFAEVARDRCSALMDGALGYWQPPSRAGWAAGDRFVRCLARRVG